MRPSNIHELARSVRGSNRLKPGADSEGCVLGLISPSRLLGVTFRSTSKQVRMHARVHIIQPAALTRRGDKVAPNSGDTTVPRPQSARTAL